jgi:DNA-binding MurR/RpiR family transcriptional regulator
MSTSPEGSFLARVRSRLADLHPAERRLADFVLDFPGELASYSASELAHLANVSNATVSRFVRRLGYANYEAARRRVRVEKDDGAVLFLGSVGESDPDRFLADHLEQARLNVQRTFASISMAEIDALADAVLDARRVFLIGMRAGHVFATYLRRQLSQIVADITLLPIAGETLAESLASIGPKDCVVIVSLRRRPALIEAVTTAAVASGARVALLGDEAAERRSDVTWHLRCQTGSLGPLFDHGSVLAVCHLLATRVITRSGRAGRSRLTAVEQMLDTLGELRGPEEAPLSRALDQPL